MTRFNQKQETQAHYKTSNHALFLLQELVFMGERCVDSKTLRDYGICHEFIKQVKTLPLDLQ